MCSVRRIGKGTAAVTAAAATAGRGIEREVGWVEEGVEMVEGTRWLTDFQEPDRNLIDIGPLRSANIYKKNLEKQYVCSNTRDKIKNMTGEELSKEKFTTMGRGTLGIIVKYEDHRRACISNAAENADCRCQSAQRYTNGELSPGCIS
ncbi:hypothetical protein M0802_000387 [Mischocyttarus mexicanus]|nr:hypothetical protein M0802_000387 [Mischocyttarus mexicanus]